MRKIYVLVVFGVLASSLFSCKEYRPVISDIFKKPSARTLYLRDLSTDTLRLKAYTNTLTAALADSLRIPIPYVEEIQQRDSIVSTVSYTADIKEGMRFLIEAENLQFNEQLFILIYPENNPDNLIKEASLTALKPKFEFKDHGVFKIVIQPSLSGNLNSALHFYAEPRYSFPVSGKNTKAIKSFWGDSRSGGKRRHKGVDIFAKRGTPVVAAVNGFVYRTGNYGLGGKQVWLKQGVTGNSLYYAHLDSVASKTGRVVKIGDTLGFVGNTGNARTTPPHLHFGIYKSGRGAVNPLPFLKTYAKEEWSKSITNYEFLKAKALANVRQGPGTRFNIITQLKTKDTLTLLGRSKTWYRVQLNDGTHGFVHQSLVKPVKTKVLG